MKVPQATIRAETRVLERTKSELVEKYAVNDYKEFVEVYKQKQELLVTTLTALINKLEEIYQTSEYSHNMIVGDIISECSNLLENQKTKKTRRISSDDFDQYMDLQSRWRTQVHVSELHNLIDSKMSC